LPRSFGGIFCPPFQDHVSTVISVCGVTSTTRGQCLTTLHFRTLFIALCLTSYPFTNCTVPGVKNRSCDLSIITYQRNSFCTVCTHS
jgi:hypothetical protein